MVIQGLSACLTRPILHQHSCLSGGFGRSHKITMANDIFHPRSSPAASLRKEGNPQDEILDEAQLGA